MIPEHEIKLLPESVATQFRLWRTFLYNNVQFNMPDSEIHAAAHCERVLLHALLIGNEVFHQMPSMVTALAHAAVFHDSRRQDDYLDTGHGARAAVYYSEYCQGHPEIEFMPEAALMMKYHDIDDKRGKAGIVSDFEGAVPRVLKLYDIFKDADALDRWRLGSLGLDPAFLRTPQAKQMVEYARRLVNETVPKEILDKIDCEMHRCMNEK